MAVETTRPPLRASAPRLTASSRVLRPSPRGSWTFREGSTVNLTVRHLSHREPLFEAPLSGRIVSDGTGAFLASAAVKLSDRAGEPGLVFRSLRILSDEGGRLTIPGSLVLGEEPLEVSFHGVLLPAEPGDVDGVIRLEAHAELDRAGMRFLAGALEAAVLHPGHGRLGALIVAVAEQ